MAASQPRPLRRSFHPLARQILLAIAASATGVALAHCSKPKPPIRGGCGEPQRWCQSPEVAAKVGVSANVIAAERASCPGAVARPEGPLEASSPYASMPRGGRNMKYVDSPEERGKCCYEAHRVCRGRPFQTLAAVVRQRAWLL